MASPSEKTPPIEIIRRVVASSKIPAETMLAYLLAHLGSSHMMMTTTGGNVFSELMGMLKLFKREENPPVSLLGALDLVIEMQHFLARSNLAHAKKDNNQAGIDYNERHVAIAQSIHLIIQQLI